MDLADLLLFLHIVAAIIWIGSGFFAQLLGSRADKASDDAFLAKLMQEIGVLGNKLFVPASLAVLLLGIALVVESDAWGFGQLWIVLGLVGYAMTFVTGAFVLGPTGEKLGAQMAADRGMTPETRAGALRLLALARLDLVVLLMVVFVMAVKPTGDDVGVLVGMALVFVVGVALVFMRAKSIGAETGAAHPAT